MAWRTATIIRARYGAGKSCTESMAQTLRDHDKYMLGLPFEVSGTGNTASGSWTQVGTFYVYGENYGSLTLNVLPTVDGNGMIRLEDDATGVTGNEYTFNVGSPTEAATTLTLDSTAAWTNLTVTTAVGRLYTVEMKATAGTVTYDLDDRLTCWWSET